MSAKSKTKHYWCYDDTLLFNFRFIWDITPKGLSKYIRREFGNKVRFEDFAGKALKVDPADLKKHSEPCYIVVLNEWTNDADAHATLAHECMHVAGMICRDRGIKAKWGNDEAFCYIAARLVRHCTEAVTKK